MTLSDEPLSDQSPSGECLTQELAREADPAAAAPPRREPLYFVVIVLLCVDILFGLGLAYFAENVLGFRPMAFVGLGLAVLGLGVLGYFVLLGDGKRK